MVLMNGWINEFVYRTSIGSFPFVVATCIAAVIVIFTTGFRAMRAAFANPTESLRIE